MTNLFAQLVIYIKGSSIIDPLTRFYYDLFLSLPLLLVTFFVFCILYIIGTHLGLVNNWMRRVEATTRKRKGNPFRQVVALLRNVNVAAPAIFFAMFLFGVNLFNDIWYHDHYGLDGFWAPTHWVFYAVMPIIVLILFGQTVEIYFQKKRGLVFWMWFGGWMALVSMVTNFIWHGFDLVETFIAPPHVLFFPPFFMMMFPVLYLFLEQKKKKILSWKARSLADRATLFLCFLTMLVTVLALIQWPNHPQDIGVSGFVNLSKEYAINHPNIEVRPAILQVDALRKSTPFLIPIVYALIFSVFSTFILKMKIFPGALSLIFLISFGLCSIFHFQANYIPVVVAPLILLELYLYAKPTRILSKSLFLTTSIFLCLIFYVLYYPYSFLISGVHWPVFIALQVVGVTFIVSLFANWFTARIIKWVFGLL